MAALSESTVGFFRKITALGPIKMEVVSYNAGSDGDTFISLLSNPKFVMAFEDGQTQSALNVTLDAVASSATFKTVTMTAVTATNPTAKWTVLVFGF